MKFKIKANKYKYVIYDDFHEGKWDKGYINNNYDITDDINKALLFDSFSKAISMCEDQIYLDLDAIEDDDRTERTYTIIQVVEENGQIKKLKTVATLRTGDYL